MLLGLVLSQLQLGVESVKNHKKTNKFSKKRWGRFDLLNKSVSARSPEKIEARVGGWTSTHVGKIVKLGHFAKIVLMEEILHHLLSMKLYEK